MNAIALALPGHLTAAVRPTPTAAATAAPVPTATATAVAGLHLQAETCIAQTADLLRLACRRGQLEDAAAAARVALPLALPHSPHAAMLHALADARPVLMTAPEERRLYLLRSADGVSHGVLRLRDNGRIGLNPPARADHWRLHDGNLELCDVTGEASLRFALCGERQGLRLYLGERVGPAVAGALADSVACVLEELRCTFTRLAMLDPELLDPFVGLYGAAEMVPTPLPAGAALLLGTANSRMDLLAQALNRQAGVHFDGELLHPQAMQLAEHLPSRSAARNLHALRAKDPAWFARMVIGRSHDALGRDMASMAVRGFCMAPAHGDAALDWALDEPTLRIVHVVRSNALAAFADMLAEQQINHRGALHFEPERFGRYIEMTQRHQAGLRERLCHRGGDTVQVDGSRLNAATLAELLGFLHDAPDGNGFSSTGVPAPAQRVIDRFDNPEAVMACLRALDRPGWAEVEGQVVDPD